MTYKPAPEIFRSVFDIVKVNVKNNIDVDIYYDYGTIDEIVGRLTEKDRNFNNKTKKYPLVWFLIDGFLEFEVNNPATSSDTLKNLTIVICKETKAEFTSAERYNNNIVPILRPIYEELMKQLKQTSFFSSKDYSHKMYENIYWGKNGLFGVSGNVLNDRVDAILIENLDLFINDKC